MPQLRPVVRAVLAAALLIALSAGVLPGDRSIARAATDPRFFPETGFRVGDDRFWDFFQRRGGIRAFGYPVSRTFLFQGFQVQFFQRGAMQLGPDGSVRTLNLLDDGLLPYTEVNGSIFPAADESTVTATPSPSAPDYAEQIVDFIRRTAPDTWEGLPVRFFATFTSTVDPADAFPDGGGTPSLVPLLNLELWGAPTSQPAYDPNNHSFVYQRFQRGIAHYDTACQCTQGLLLGDLLKSVITGRDLPPDLGAQASTSPLYRQYDPGAPGGLRRPKLLPDTDLTNAFEPETPRAPTAAPATDGAAPYVAASPEYGMNVFLWGNPRTTDRDLALLDEAGFGWQKTLFQWRLIEGRCKGCFDWSEADRVVAESNRRGVKVVARLDFQPSWARADGAQNGPPDREQDYADFVRAFVDRYRTGSPHGRVHAIEVWNEPNLDREWGMAPIGPASAADYVRLLRAAYLAAKEADPAVTVISAGLSPTCTDGEQARPDDAYLQWMYDAGAAPYFDVLGAHGAGYDKPPSASPDESAVRHGGCRVFTFRRVEDLRAVMERNSDGQKQIWLLEFGWTTDPVHPAYAWHAISPETHAEYVVDAYRWAHDHWSPWIGVMLLWNLPDPGWGPDREEYWRGITNPDGSPRPAFERLAEARKAGRLP